MLIVKGPILTSNEVLIRHSVGPFRDSVEVWVIRIQIPVYSL